MKLRETFKDHRLCDLACRYRRSPLLRATDWGQSLRLALAGKAASLVGRDYAENLRIPTAAAFIPPPVRPHPLLGGLADEGFEPFLEGGGGDDGVGLAIAGLGDGNARRTDDEMDIGAADRSGGV